MTFDEILAQTLELLPARRAGLLSGAQAALFARRRIPRRSEGRNHSGQTPVACNKPSESPGFHAINRGSNVGDHIAHNPASGAEITGSLACRFRQSPTPRRP